MTLTMARVKVGNRPVVGKYINISSEDKAYETVPKLLFPESEEVVVCCIVLDKCCVGAARGDI